MGGTVLLHGMTRFEKVAELVDGWKGINSSK
jgi:hypothetical protein